MTRTFLAAFALITAVLVSSVARAAPHDPVSAEALFDEGRRLMKEQRYVEACAKLEASQRLDPGVGTLLNLGDCLEHAGRTASAWVRFREAASLAVASSQNEREQAARARARALEVRLVRLVVRPARSAAGDAGLQIVRDGVVLERESWGSAVPVDPGRHVVRATSPGKVAWSTEIELSATASGSTRTVEVPALESERQASEAQAFEWTTRRTVAAIAGGLGVVSLGLGSYFALDAKTTYDSAKDRCTPRGCDSGALEQARSAGTSADVATGLLIGGAVALAVGAVLFITAPRQAKALRSLGISLVPLF
ncbi:MAG TPA: hypothetical protein VM925_26340 [Labilithrix sp.]|nr:hypothetical protein [Labilithrix sp.]